MFYKKVETYCKKKKIPLSVFEKQCGLGNGTIRGWITSKPRLDTIEKVAKEMGVSVSELLKEGV